MKTVECGFIDELKYKPEVEAYVKELAGQNGEKLRSANLAQMKTLKASPTKNAPEIAVLYAEGEIKAQTPGNFYDIEQSITEKMADELIKLKNNDDVKAVVFRADMASSCRVEKGETCGRFHGQRSCLGRLLYLMRR